jgi:hypothetical protein
MVRQDGKTYFVAATGAMVVSPGGDGTVLPVATPAPIPAPPTAPAPAPTPAQLGDVFTTPDAGTLPALLARPGVVTAQLLTGNQILLATTLTLTQVAAFPELTTVTPSLQGDVLGDVTPTDPYYGPRPRGRPPPRDPPRPRRRTRRTVAPTRQAPRRRPGPPAPRPRSRQTVAPPGGDDRADDARRRKHTARVHHAA